MVASLLMSWSSPWSSPGHPPGHPPGRHRGGTRDLLSPAVEVAHAVPAIGVVHDWQHLSPPPPSFYSWLEWCKL